MNKNFTKSNQKGITLIALIVTIIVLIIIAGISIATLTADNGILRQTNLAKITQIEATAREQVKLACSAMRLAIAEARADDNSYSAIANSKSIQAKLLEMIEDDNTGLDKEGWGTEAEVNDNVETFTITYAGDDYIQACNPKNREDAKIIYTIKLGQSAIEITNEVNATLQDEEGNDVEIDIGGDNQGSGGNNGGAGGSGPVQSECGLYFGGKYTLTEEQEGVTTTASYVFYENGRADFFGSFEYVEGYATYGQYEVFMDGSRFCTVSSDGMQLTGESWVLTLESNNGAVQSECGLYFGEKYSTTMDGAKVTYVFYENGGMYECTAFEIPEGTYTYGQYEILTDGETAFTVSSDGTQVVADGLTYTLETGSGSGSEEQTVAAGLYETGSNYTVLLTPWEDLLADGTVHVENGVVYTDGNIMTNDSSAALAGDLLLPDDASITAIGNAIVDLESGSDTGNVAFAACTSLTSITIPDGVISISDYAICACTSLTNVSIPSSVTTIGLAAFAECTSLNTITFEGTVAQWNAITFGMAWNNGVPATMVTCSDGTVSLS